MTKLRPYNTGYAITDDDRVLLRKALRTAIYDLRHHEYPFGNYVDGQKQADEMERLLRDI